MSCSVSPITASCDIMCSDRRFKQISIHFITTYTRSPLKLDHFIWWSCFRDWTHNNFSTCSCIEKVSQCFIKINIGCILFFFLLDFTDSRDQFMQHSWTSIPTIRFCHKDFYPFSLAEEVCPLPSLLVSMFGMTSTDRERGTRYGQSPPASISCSSAAILMKYLVFCVKSPLR